MKLNDSFYHRKSQTVALCGMRGVSLIKLVKDTICIGAVGGGEKVAYADTQIVLLSGNVKSDFCSLGGKFDCIVKKIYPYLPE